MALSECQLTLLPGSSEISRVLPPSSRAPKREAYGSIDPALAGVGGLTFRELRATLRPRYWLVWLEIGLGHAFLWAILVALTLADDWWQQLLAAVLGAVCLGYCIAYLQLFFHEGAHFLLAPKRALNDFLANSLLGLFTGQNIKHYRRIHFAHHRALGRPDDTERTYFERLTPRFILESVTGIRVVKVLLLRRRALATKLPTATTLGSRWPLVCGLVLHAGLLAILLFLGHFGAAIAWCTGLGMVYPFLFSLRQLLEHRAVEPGGTTPPECAASHRLFGTGLLASTLGGAGFNRHLLHHMEPQISCTRLAELECFLMGTDRADWLNQHRTTYLRTFLALLARERMRSVHGLLAAPEA